MNDITNVIMSIEEGKEKYDNALKELLANRQFLSRILKRFVPEFKNCRLNDIEEIYIEPQKIFVSDISVERNLTNLERHAVEGLSNEDNTQNEANIKYDIIFKAFYPDLKGKLIGMYINIEAQNNYYPGYPIEVRGMFYAARRFGSQLKSITGATDYGRLEKVYSVWICMGNVPDKEAGTATLYRTVKDDIIGTVDRERTEFDFINVIVIRLNDRMKAEDAVLGMLQALCSRRMTKENKMEALKEYGIRLTEVEEEVNNMCNLSDWVFDTAIESGMKKGMEKGIEKGMEQGIQQVSLELLRDGMPYERVAKYAGVPVEKLKLWEKECR